jgi:hypothetical protein
LKPNYGFERSQRARAKAIKKQEKLHRRDQATARRKALKGDQTAIDSDGVLHPVEDSVEPKSK